MYELSRLGFSPFFEQQIINHDAIVARIAAEHRGGYHVWSSTGTGFARLAGSLKHELEGETLPGVGDWVTLKSVPASGQTSMIESVLRRNTVFIRGAAGRQARGQVIAANVDTVFIVCGLDNDYNLHRIERYLARVWASGALPVVVLNKSDVCDNVLERIEEVDAIALGTCVVATSAIHSEGLDEIQSRILPGMTAALVGSSGAGKSSLINALMSERIMATKEIRSRDGRGCHTTTHRQLLMLPNGGLLIDTPGMRELQLFDEEGIGAVFSDIEELSAHCRFRDCSHISEPGCAIREAVERGEISADRFEHYHKMLKEGRAYELRHNQHKKRKAERVWGQLYAEAERIRRWKRSR